jgi:glycine dehydrogenase
MKNPVTSQRTPPPTAARNDAAAAPTSHNGSPSDLPALLAPSDTFLHRHIGPTPQDVALMLRTIGVSSVDELIDQTIPSAIRLRQPLKLPAPRGEHELLQDLRAIANKNQVLRSCIGMGYFGTIVPPVIQRNILENPGWYTQYTPYQAEISQGRLESLLNFQTMVADLTGLPLANASLLDEATAAAEAMAMCVAVSAASAKPRHAFFIADNCHPQTIHVVQTRGSSMSVQIIVAPAAELTDHAGLHQFCGALLQYPDTNGHVADHAPLIDHLHTAGVLAVVATDLLALCLLRPPGEFGADITVGSAQRFGVPLGFGGPHAAFLSTRTEHARRLPGRLVGVSRDAQGSVAYRLTLQTREQHIRRDKATSHICTAQALLANMAAMYAVYHGPAGLRQIARRVHALTGSLAAALTRAGNAVADGPFFDTIKVRPAGRSAAEVLSAARKAGINLRDFADGQIGISLDETTTVQDVRSILSAFSAAAAAIDFSVSLAFPATLARTSAFLTHSVFNQYHSETEMLRYITRLQSRDLSLAQSMIPLGSCTMKLNATSEMLPVTWPEFADLHPYAPADQCRGYAEMIDQLANWLSEIAGMAACSLQPNAGSQGEYAGLLVIRAYHAARGQAQRDICLIPVSAHGTNPASAVIAGLHVVAVDCDQNGNVDLPDLRKKVVEHQDRLAAIMVTYPSTHGVFEESIRELCQIIHDSGGQVYMDGANMNAQVGLCRPGDIGADVCHLNLHKTFCIPHGGGGPGMGPICVAKHLAPFLPGDPAVAASANTIGPAIGPVSAAPFGSALILTVSWVYIALMGPAGLRRATEIAILSANFMAKRLSEHFPVLFAGRNGRVAHEFILDARQLDKSAGIKVEDIAKRLMDYGFHAPTISFPEPGTLMIEPTESESKRELDRFCDALIAIRHEIREIEQGRSDRADNPLKNAPHTIAAVSANDWPHKYPRQQAAFPAPWLHEFKFWPAVARIDNPYGDRNLFCSCPPTNAGE